MKITINELRKVVRQIVEQKKKEKGWLARLIDTLSVADPIGPAAWTKRAMDSIEKDKAKKEKKK